MRLSELLGPAKLVLIAVCLLVVAAISVHAQNPQSGNISISGIVPGDPPTDPAVINNPTQGETFTTDQITVSGTCPLFTTVLIYRNDVFAGSTSCLGSGTFSLSITLTTGQNDLVAKVMDALNQFGPDSTRVTIYYDKPASPSQTGQFIPSLLLSTSAVYRGTFPGDETTIDLTIVGGKPSYALVINWGDGQEELIALSIEGKNDFTHIYKQPGTYVVSFRATDSAKQTAYLQTVVVVNGEPEQLATNTINEISYLVDKTPPVFSASVLFIGVFTSGFYWGRKNLKSGKFE